MRVSKRILALALALLMIVGLFSTASARNLGSAPDRGEVDPAFSLAVGALYTFGILEGFPDGTFRPETTVNRAQMTNLIFDMMHGTDQAPPLIVTQFPDVYDGSGAWWARGYIAWAHGAGIVVGFPDGTFRPNDPVTIVQAATMLLRALGYGQNGEFQGTGWAQRAANEAVRQGIFNADIVDNFDIADGAQRQIAAQMVFNTMFAARVQFYSALEVYRPLQPRATFGQRFNLPVLRSDLVKLNGNNPVVVAGFSTPMNGQGTTVTTANPLTARFLNLDVNLSPATLGAFTVVAGNIVGTPVAYAVQSWEVGRVVDVWGIAGTAGDPGALPDPVVAVPARALFLDILSTDVTVPAGATGGQRVTDLGITNANAATRSNNVGVFAQYAFTNEFANVAAITGAVGASTAALAAPAVPATPVTQGLLTRMATTWVLYDDGTNNAFRTVLYSSRTIESVTAFNWVVATHGAMFPTFTAPDGTPVVVIGDVAAGATVYRRSDVELTGGLTWAMFDRTTVGDGWNNILVPPTRGMWANVTATATGVTLTPVITRTGVIAQTVSGPDGLEVRFAGEVGLTLYAPSNPFANAQDGMNSQRISAIDNIGNVFTTWATSGMPNANTTLWTAYYSGLTGDIIAIELWTPDLVTGAELVMVTQAAWDTEAQQVGQAQFVRANGETRALGPALPVVGGAPGAFTNDVVRQALNATRGLVAWAIEVNGVYYLRPVFLSDVSSAPGAGVVAGTGNTSRQIWIAGHLGANVVTAGQGMIQYGNAQDALYNVGAPLVAAPVVTQARSLTTNVSRFITSAGATNLFPNAPAGQTPTAAFSQVVFVLDTATLETVETVFVLTGALVQPAAAPWW